jgi:archaellum component FlaC
MPIDNVQSVKELLIELTVRTNGIEKQINQLESSCHVTTDHLGEIKSKIEGINLSLSQKVNVSSSNEEHDKIKNKISEIELELPELKLMKRIFILIISFFFTSFIGLTWNFISNKEKASEISVEEIAKKILSEYQDQDKKK